MSATKGVMDVPGRHTHFLTIPIHAAADATQELTWVPGFACRVFKVEVYPGAAITGADTNTCHLNVDIPRGTEKGNYDFTSGNDGAVGTAIALYSNTTGTALTAAQAMGIEREKVGTGLATPDMCVRIEFQYE